MFNKAKKNTIYSIRKSAMGAASVTIGTCLLLGMTHTASADEREQNRIDSETTTAPKQGTNESNSSATQSTSPTSTENHKIHTKQADTIHKETEKRKETAINRAKQSINDSTESIPNQNTSNRNSNKLKPEQKMENHITEQQKVEDNITKQQAGTSNTKYQKEPLLENNAKQKGVKDTKIQKQQQ
ncbi:YSIRK-type signal peptide-containing protein [Staphylococcus saprophyticus]